MTTPSFSLTSTERVLPKLALDFTTANLDTRITFSRTTGASNPATYVNNAGFIAYATNNQPRFDFNPITLACKGLLIEESRANAYLYSNDYTQSFWGTNGVTINSANVQLSPDNVSYMQKIEETNINGVHRLLVNTPLPATVSGTKYTVSFFAKKAERDIIDVFESSYIGAVVARFDLTAGTAQSLNASASVTITPYKDGVYRCTCTMAAQSTSNPGFINRFQLYNGSSSYVGTVGYGLYLWGMQFETGDFATSYIPTTSTALTRNADVATMTGTNFSNWFNASEGAAVVQVLPSTISGTRPAIEFDDNTANQAITLRGVAADPQLFVVNGGAAQATLDAGTITANAVYKLGGAWKSSSFATSVNGGGSVSQLSGTYPTVTQARLGSDGTNYLNGCLQNLRYWPQRITNAETQAFSK